MTTLRATACCGHPEDCQEFCKIRVEHLEKTIESLRSEVFGPCRFTVVHSGIGPKQCSQRGCDRVKGKAFCKTHFAIVKHNLELFTREQVDDKSGEAK
jgi:hypothetical protein